METLLNRYRNLLVLVFVLVAQLLLLAYQVKSNQDVTLLRTWAVTAVTPLARVLEFVRRNTIGVAEDYFVLVNVRNENIRLGKEIGQLKMENQYLKTELSTADRAQALRAFQTRTPSRTLPARVIGNGTGTNSRVVFVDRGSVEGVKRGMAVVTPDGIVGKVLASYPTASQVLLITDPTFAAGVISQKNRVHGTLKGIGQAKCIVDYVQNEEKVDQNEVFYTSGDDRVFPKGLPVGVATVVRPGKSFKEIFIVPGGFQNGLEEVLIVLEGVHQAIPEATAAPSSETYLMPPAPDSAQKPSDPATLFTDADKMRERYKKIGEVQKHVYGEGVSGGRPPDFNVNPDKTVPVKPAVPPAQPGTAGNKTNPTPAAPAPVTPNFKAKPTGPATDSRPPVAPPTVRSATGESVQGTIVKTNPTAPGAQRPAQKTTQVPSNAVTSRPAPVTQPKKPPVSTTPPSQEAPPRL